MKRNLKNYNRCIRYVYEKLRGGPIVFDPDWWMEKLYMILYGLLSLLLVIISPLLLLGWCLVQLQWYIRNMPYWFSGKESKNKLWKEAEKQIEEEENKTELL